jgi:ribosomal protein S18 acetylase RimI-like enzyme
MLLRSYRSSDLETLYQIDQACFPPAVSYSRQELSEFITDQKSETWVAEEDGKIVGFLVADRQRPRLIHIITIDVAAEWRRQGVGTLLMDAAETAARRQDSRLIYLETSAQNVSAQRFYLQRGYEKCQVISRYYGNGDAAWVMVKYLDK